MSVLYGFISIINIASSAIISGYCVAGLITLIARRSRTQAQLLVANGVLLGISLKLAATLLKTIETQSWSQIGQLVSIILLTALIKKTFAKTASKANKQTVARAS